MCATENWQRFIVYMIVIKQKKAKVVADGNKERKEMRSETKEEKARPEGSQR
jgi:hypothetical protein